jgi:enamine deaminase RidA (YjgF/YER057c/UK114 family)
VSDQRDPQPLARDAASWIPYSPGLRVGDTIHVSGTIGRPPDGDLPADIAEQFRQLYPGRGDCVDTGSMPSVVVTAASLHRA